MGSSSSEALSRGGLDWVCIGAQKAGTTTLHHLLESHPAISMPSARVDHLRGDHVFDPRVRRAGIHEDPIFDHPVDRSAVAEYLRSRFGAAPDSAKCGKVTPQYMFAPEIAERVHAHVPDARVIAILRDPVRRAFSQYRMNARRGFDTRTFAGAVRGQVGLLSAAKRPDPDNERETYVWRGCYSTILAPWLELFGPERMLILFTSDLESRQAAVLARVHEFIGVEPLPATGGDDLRAQSAPPPHRLSKLRRPVAGTLRRLGLLGLMSREQKLRLVNQLERTLGRLVPAEPSSVDAETEALLRGFYAQEDERLRSLLGQDPPWAHGA